MQFNSPCTLLAIASRLIPCYLAQSQLNLTSFHNDFELIIWVKTSRNHFVVISRTFFSKGSGRADVLFQTFFVDFNREITEKGLK